MTTSIATDSKSLSITRKFLFVGTVFALLAQALWLNTTPLEIQQRDDTNTFAAPDRNASSNISLSACSGFNGVLHIAQGDGEGAAGTIFFLFIINQLIYAEIHNLIPWVHLNNVSQYVYDDKIHGIGHKKTFEMICGKTVSWHAFFDPISKQQHRYPGKPQGINLVPCNIAVEGNGVWSSYFDPVSKFNPGDPSCTSLPLIRMTYSQIIPALHVFAPWSVRAWRYGGLPPSLQKPNETYQEWFAPMRQLGHAMVQKYIRFLPFLRERAVEQNPLSECLALHIRHSDKANRRKRIPVQRFFPYVEAFYHHQMQRNVTSFSIYLATDSSNVIDIIQETWPDEIKKALRWQKGDVVRSNDTTAVFKITGRAGHHDTNIQVLTDILAMSHCQYFLHGLSAVSEAVQYLNPNLHFNASVNLDDRKRDIVTVKDFQDIMLSISAS
jgi:hypothetical protein